MKEPVEIRLAEDRDFVALAKIHAAVFTPRWDAKALREFSSAPGTDTLSASVENILAGFVMARSVLDEAEILTIAVKPDYQRQGLGQALLIEAGARAHRRGATRMFLEVGAENTAALRLYEKLGFVRIGWRKSYYTAANETASQNAASMRGILPFPSKSLGKAPWSRLNCASVISAQRTERALPTRIEKLCIDRGLRMTDQRRTIARVLSEAVDHPDAEELYRRSAALDPHISIATVYRTVKLFEDAGILERHDFRDGRSRYEEIQESHHDHLIDVQTGRVVEFRNEEIEKLQRRVAEELGFELVDHRLELYGKPIVGSDDTKR